MTISAAPILLVCVCLTAPAAGEGVPEPGPETAPPKAWTPRDESRGAFQDIVDFNIFLPDRAKLTEARDRRDNPPTPRQQEPTVEVEVSERIPPNPDEKLLLIGVSRHGSVSCAFIEDRDSGEVTRVGAPAEYAQGQITEVQADHGRLTYVVGGEARTIAVGYTLAGEEAAPAGRSSVSTTSTPDTTPPADGQTAPAVQPGSREDILRRLRERRNNE